MGDLMYLAIILLNNNNKICKNKNKVSVFVDTFII